MYFQRGTKKNHVFIYNIFYFLFLKYNHKKTFNFKTVQLGHVMIKMSIFAVLKPNRGSI
jgi:hypothetical protein